ncbi:pyridoxamine 5'-phosphate oxidase family protein [uncultured Friedmanniella sp.]|uniref:pyridoxamine 5'-phosphate oxidase family protein n=1 Tax=uncultured Friedmanniella sp. TaxID=335381 RepID=UPI0035CB5C0D
MSTPDASTPDSYPSTPRTTATRSRERMTYDRELVHAVLDEGLLCHVGFVVDDAPVVLPQLHVRVGEVLYLHGSTGARALRTAARDGLPVCVTVTLVDGVVLARSAFHHSINYRSVVVQGRAELVSDPAEKSAALTALVDGVVAGRSAGVRGPSVKELAATAVLRLPLVEVSAKVRRGDPKDDEEDLDAPYWAGVVPLTVQPGPPQPSADLTPGLAVPDHVATWRPGA